MKTLKKILNSKIVRSISIAFVLVLMTVLIANNQSNSNNIDAKAKTATITVINADENSGKVTIAYKNLEGEYVNTNSTSYTVSIGTKVKMYYENGLNDGYSIYCWANYENSCISIVKNTGDETYYTNESFVQTINSDKTVYVYAKTATSHIVSFYNTNIDDKDVKKLVGFAFAENGQSCDASKVKAPHMGGKDFLGWNSDLSNITEDIEVAPNYKYSVWTVWRDYYPMFLKGLGVTLLLSVVSVFIALFLGMGITFIRLSNSTIFKFIATAYVEIIRGVPLLLQLLIIYIVLGPTKIHIGSFFSTEVLCCIIALFINSSAYTSEIFRSGIQAVDKGQMEAGRALGMSKWKVMFKIVMPQGIKNSLPSIGNELVAMIKETSLAVSIDASIGELMSVRKQITSGTYINLPPFIIVAIIYFIVTFTLSKLIGLLEKRLSKREF